MKPTILILTLISAIPGCTLPELQIVDRVDVAAPARQIVEDAGTIQAAAAAGAGVAREGQAVAPELPHWGQILGYFARIGDKAAGIASAARKIEAAQDAIDEGNKREASLRGQIQAYRESDAQWRARAWGMLAVAGGLLLVSAAVSLVFGVRLVSAALALGGIAAIGVGSVMASSEGLIVWLGVGVAVVIAVSAAHWAISRRSAVDRSWDRIADMARHGLDGKDDLRAFVAAMRSKFDQFDQAMEQAKGAV